MSCALWLHNYALRPIIIERESELGGMARLDPYPNAGLLGRPGESGRDNAKAFVRHVDLVSIETWRLARPERIGRTATGGFELEITLGGPGSSSEAAARILSAPAIVIATGTWFEQDAWLDRVGNARRIAERGHLHVGAPWAWQADRDHASHVAVIGGGDNAFDVSRMLVEKAIRVTIVMRSHTPRAQPLLVQRLSKHQGSGMAEVRAGRTVLALDDADGRVRLHLNDGKHFEADRVLLLLGYRPNTAMSWITELGVATDSSGYVVVDANMETTCPGAFAVGDVATPAHPCVATAIGTGARAARVIALRLRQSVVSDRWR
jgi:thioredoxin reductase